MNDDEAGHAVLRQAVERYEAVLGSRLLAAYVLGSLAHGGFSPLVSDVDLGLVLTDPVDSSDAPTVGAVAEEIKAGGSPLHERLSVFWGTPSTLRGEQPGGRFPPLDRLDLLENGRLLAGAECRTGLNGPGRDELLLAGAGFALDFLGPGRAATDPSSARLGSLKPAGREVLAEIRQPQQLARQEVRHLTKVVLFPVRFLFTAATGRVGTNHAAVEYYRADPKAPAHALVGQALTWRTTAPDPGAAADLLDRELLALYLQYIDDHIARLRDLGADDLGADFTAWRGELTA
ncbi:MAG TPA: hypothetical protein VEG38_03215 [Acidimicrobiia bacterium]|nr:hypothetical protein [Acidimicrobiia bacterium]